MKLNLSYCSHSYYCEYLKFQLVFVGEELALVPYADLMNHNPYSNTYIDAQKSGMPLISRIEEVAVYADRNYKKFEQVFINYGEKGNADLLLLYGFALDRNPFDSGGIGMYVFLSSVLVIGRVRLSSGYICGPVEERPAIYFQENVSR